MASYWPELVKVALFPEVEDHPHFDFVWPQQGDVDPSIFGNVRITAIKVLNNYNLRAMQVKLSNGLVSPVFGLTYAGPGEKSG